MPVCAHNQRVLVGSERENAVELTEETEDLVEWIFATKKEKTNQGFLNSVLRFFQSENTISFLRVASISRSEGSMPFLHETIQLNQNTCFVFGALCFLFRALSGAIFFLSLPVWIFCPHYIPLSFSRDPFILETIFQNVLRFDTAVSFLQRTRKCSSVQTQIFALTPISNAKCCSRATFFRILSRCRSSAKETWIFC